MNRTWKIRGLVAAALSSVSMQGCSLSGGPLSGVVLDKETNQPVVGVIVVARWHGNWTKIVESSSACYHVETTRTDASGRYQIPSWRQAPRLADLRFSSGGNEISLYKPGYVDLSDGSEGQVYMQRFIGTNKEYFQKVLVAYRWACDQPGASNNNLYRVFKAAFADAVSRSETSDQLRMVNLLQRQMQESLVDTSQPTIMLGDRAVNANPGDALPPKD